MPQIVKTVYLLRTKSCARFGLNFSLFLLCQVKIPADEKKYYTCLSIGKKNKQTSSSVLLATAGL